MNVDGVGYWNVCIGVCGEVGEMFVVFDWGVFLGVGEKVVV